MINDNIERSLFVFAKDVHTGKITRVAIPTDVQIGTIGSSAELTLLGRFSINMSSYVLGVANNGSVYLNNSDTIACINYDGAYDGTLNVTLPGYPRIGQLHFIKDSSGTANMMSIAIHPASSDEFIDQTLSVSIDTKYGSVALFWSGERWLTLISGGSSSGSGAPLDATYYTVNDESARLSYSRYITWGSNLATVDSGAGGTFSVDLATTTVTPDSYTNANITVDSYGRITNASNGSGGSTIDPNIVSASYVTLNVESGTLPNSRYLNLDATNFTTVDHGSGSAFDVNLSTTAVSSGTYTNATIIVDSYGRITSASNGSGGSSSSTSVWPLVAGPRSTYLSGWVQAGETYMTPPSTCTLNVMGSCAIGRTLSWRLWNQDDGIVIVSGSTTSSIGEKMTSSLASSMSGFSGSIEKRISLHFHADEGAHFVSRVTIIAAEIRQ